MSSLFLIRHGQAVYSSSADPALSELGVRQAGLLGRWVGASGLRIDALYSGPRLRQTETARHLMAAVPRNGRPDLEPQVVPELDEYPAQVILHAWLSRSAEARQTAAPLADPGLAAAARWRILSPLLWQASGAWMRGELEVPESFGRFAERVRGALGQIRAREGRSRRVAVVTSAGPVGVALRCALGLDDASTLRLVWAVNNTSLTELRYRGEEMNLAGFNALPHLTPELVT